jgi:DNA-binding NtrC family response regulator
VVAGRGESDIGSASVAGARPGSPGAESPSEERATESTRALPTALIIDDDADSLEALTALVGEAGYKVRGARNLEEARKLIDCGPVALALLDLELPDGSGLELLEPLEQIHGAEVVIVTGHGAVDSAVTAFRSGVVDYLTKPLDLGRLRMLLAKAQRTADLRHQIQELRRELRLLGRFGSMVGVSAGMQEVYDLLQRVAPTDATVLLLGETGTGKELAAQTVHTLSRRAAQPFIDVNCGALPPSLIEAELFGHEKGSFTGALRSRAGIFERADHGTLLLDEITEMPPELQVKLLRVLETSRLRRVGGDQDIEVDVRIVAATNRDPETAVREGKLREDLMYRLSVFPIRIPPLRERGRDAELIATHFLDELNRQRDTVKRFAPATLALISAYSWPGNVRELRNAVDRAHILCPGNLITPEHLPVTLPPEAAPGRPAGETRSEVLEIAPGMSVAEAEQKLIMATLQQVGGDKRAAARILGISLKTLYTRLREYDAR